ncbi:VOC family protein [Sphingobium nicotianae]|uniref:VOC family protein n=1 Tax=Sphingobium nicotianae TaxID=2782607 RepID=A0A9X1DAW0_9SPHN|nr:VOC family protein [Sphingobium nicotianae]MBT2186611.1 VOC family protein [Sphingobium nicotianae]
MTHYMTTCLWFDGAAEEAAAFYVTLMPDSHVDKIMRSPADNPSAQEGQVLVVEFTLGGQKFVGLNGGPMFKHSEAVSFQIHTDDQAQTDRLWDMITSNGGAESRCGWCKDRWGVSWQITPKRLTELTADPDPAVARRVFQAMMTMGKIDIAALEAAAEAQPA